VHAPRGANLVANRAPARTHDARRQAGVRERCKGSRRAFTRGNNSGKVRGAFDATAPDIFREARSYLARCIAS